MGKLEKLRIIGGAICMALIMSLFAVFPAFAVNTDMSSSFNWVTSGNATNG